MNAPGVRVPDITDVPPNHSTPATPQAARTSIRGVVNALIFAALM